MFLGTLNRTKAQGGFTLIELLVVIAILGILAGVVSFNLIRHAEEARVTKAELQIAQFKSAVQMYCIHVGHYPTTEDGLKALIERPTEERLAQLWKGPYLEDTDQIPLDPWGREYIYMSPGSGESAFEIISLGKDGAQGGEGNNADISSRRLGR